MYLVIVFNLILYGVVSTSFGGEPNNTIFYNIGDTFTLNVKLIGIQPIDLNGCTIKKSCGSYNKYIVNENSCKNFSYTEILKDLGYCKFIFSFYMRFNKNIIKDEKNIINICNNMADVQRIQMTHEVEYNIQWNPFYEDTKVISEQTIPTGILAGEDFTVSCGSHKNNNSLIYWIDNNQIHTSYDTNPIRYKIKVQNFDKNVTIECRSGNNVKKYRLEVQPQEHSSKNPIYSEEVFDEYEKLSCKPALYHTVSWILVNANNTVSESFMKNYKHVFYPNQSQLDAAKHKGLKILCLQPSCTCIEIGSKTKVLKLFECRREVVKVFKFKKKQLTQVTHVTQTPTFYTTDPETTEASTEVTYTTDSLSASGNSRGPLVGVIIGVLVLLSLLIGMLYWRLKHRNKEEVQGEPVYASTEIQYAELDLRNTGQQIRPPQREEVLYSKVKGVLYHT